jgi:hypothetical protein
MRVPNTGLDRETRVLIREGYRLAERLLRDHRDPPSPFETLSLWLAACRQASLSLLRTLARN